MIYSPLEQFDIFKLICCDMFFWPVNLNVTHFFYIFVLFSALFFMLTDAYTSYWRPWCQSLLPSIYYYSTAPWSELVLSWLWIDSSLLTALLYKSNQAFSFLYNMFFALYQLIVNILKVNILQRKNSNVGFLFLNLLIFNLGWRTKVPLVFITTFQFSLFNYSSAVIHDSKCFCTLVGSYEFYKVTQQPVLRASPLPYFLSARTFQHFSENFSGIFPLTDLTLPVEVVLGELHYLLSRCKRQKVFIYQEKSKEWLLDVKLFMQMLRSISVFKSMSLDEWVLRILVYWCDLYRKMEFTTASGLIIGFKVRGAPAETCIDAKGHELIDLILDYFMASRKFLSYHDENEGLYPWFSHDSTTFYINPYVGGIDVYGGSRVNQEVLLPASFDFFYRHIQSFFVSPIPEPE